ncbi:unnamed protein product [Prorocentrum cordatum]|uniref:KIF-binding protein n=1 Tax=Prorocentrum cordatum TaxID=2364126 RepID=A0ABN9TS33_9DINO|nr:unnamed protein product [Polarella glacialis]
MGRWGDLGPGFPRPAPACPGEDPSLALLLRPGVSEDGARASAARIQQAWRGSRAQARLRAARRRLQGLDPPAGGVGESAAAAVARAARPWHCVVGTRPPHAEPAGARGGDDAEALWDEAAAFRRISAEQAMATQARWLRGGGGGPDRGLLEEALAWDETQQLVLAMSRLEQRLQLRRQELEGPQATAFRPPCAVGAAACSELEAKLTAWQSSAQQGSAEASGPGSAAALGLLLLPCLCLFQLVAAGSYLHRGKLEDARRALGWVESAVAAAQPGSFLSAAGPQLCARVALYIAGGALRSSDYVAAVDAGMQALALLRERDGPRDFWPAHCWELAACHRAVALGLAGQGKHQEAQHELAELQRQLGAGASEAAAPRLAAFLSEDVRILRLECDVVQKVDLGPQPVGAPPEVLQALREDAEKSCWRGSCAAATPAAVRRRWWPS